MGATSPHCEERHTSCELLLDIREGPGRRTGFAVSSHSGQTTAALASEGIVSKRKDSAYRSGRSPDWLKMKNPACEAVRREAEEDWGR